MASKPSASERKRQSIAKRLRQQGCTSSVVLSGIIESLLSRSKESEEELIARWKRNRADWFRSEAA